MDREFFSWSPITRRPAWHLPGGARVALWVVPNIEHYEYLPGPVRVRNPWPRMPHPDVLGYSLRDYGNRVGVWRMLDVMDRYGIRCTVSLNIANYEMYPEIMEACESRDYDVLCHGIFNTTYLWDMPDNEQRAYIADCLNRFRRLTGKTLRGWFSPGVSYTPSTLDLVAEAGFTYCADLYHDDQPTRLNAGPGTMVSVPYSMDLNDAVLYRYDMEGEEFYRMVVDHFDTVWREGATIPRVMCIALHPYMMGQPHRIRHLDRALAYVLSHDGVWQATGAEIADQFLAQDSRPERAPHGP
jgi:allantoinase